MVQEVVVLTNDKKQAETVNTPENAAVQKFAAKIYSAMMGWAIMASLSLFSFFVNGTLGLGKVLFAVLIGAIYAGDKESELYKTAQNILELGLYQTLMAVADAAIGFISCTLVLPILAAVWNPEKADEYCDGFFGVIHKTIDVTPEPDQKYSTLQTVANKIQECLLPTPQGNSLDEMHY